MYSQLLNFFENTYKKNLSSLDLEDKTHNNSIHIPKSNITSIKRTIKQKPVKFDEYINLIKSIYNLTTKGNDELFATLYKQITDYTYKKSLKDSYDNDLFYIDMHGGFNFTNKFIQIPNNIVIVFLTPVNRFGHTCSYVDRQKIYTTFKDTQQRKNILNNILCIDKIHDSKQLNNRFGNNTKIYNYFNYFEKSIVLLPGQYYGDLNLSFSKSKENTGKNMNISYFSKSEQSSIIPEDILEYNKTLSSIIIELQQRVQEQNLTYVFVNCCRNIDYSIQNNKNNLNALYGKEIYIYENFMLYFNTLMSNCRDVYYSEKLPKIMYSKNFSKDDIVKLYTNITTISQYNTYKKLLIKQIKLYLTSKIDIINSYIIELLSTEINLLDTTNINIPNKAIQTQLINVLEIQYNNHTRLPVYLVDSSCINFIKYFVMKNLANIKDDNNYIIALKNINEIDTQLANLYDERSNTEQMQIINYLISKISNLLLLKFGNDKIQTEINRIYTELLQNINEYLTQSPLKKFNINNNSSFAIKYSISTELLKLINNIILICYGSLIDNLKYYLNDIMDEFWESIKDTKIEKEKTPLELIKEQGNKTLGSNGRKTLRNTLSTRT